MSGPACAVDWGNLDLFTKAEIAKEHKEQGACKVGPVIGGLRFYACPLLWITQETNDLLDAVHMFDDKGLLPFMGLWTDQPYWFIEAYKTYKREHSEWLKSQNRNQ